MTSWQSGSCQDITKLKTLLVSAIPTICLLAICRAIFISIEVQHGWNGKYSCFWILKTLKRVTTLKPSPAHAVILRGWIDKTSKLETSITNVISKRQISFFKIFACVQHEEYQLHWQLENCIRETRRKILGCHHKITISCIFTITTRHAKLRSMHSWKVLDIVSIFECNRRTSNALLKGKCVHLNKGPQIHNNSMLEGGSIYTQ